MAPIHSAIALDRENIAAARSRGESNASAPPQSNSLTAAAVAPNGGASPQALIAAARGGDERAFQGLVEAHWSLAARLARSILRTEEAAADAVQDALIKVYQAMPRFKDGNFRGWLLRIVTNTCYDHLRSQKRQPAVSLDQLVEGCEMEMPDYHVDRDPERQALRQERLAALSQMVNRLPTWYRDVVILVDIHGYDYGEAADFLGLPRGTVKSRLSRARSSLRDQLLCSDLLRLPPN